MRTAGRWIEFILGVWRWYRVKELCFYRIAAMARYLDSMANKDRCTGETLDTLPRFQTSRPNLLMICPRFSSHKSFFSFGWLNAYTFSHASPSFSSRFRTQGENLACITISGWLRTQNYTRLLCPTGGTSLYRWGEEGLHGCSHGTGGALQDGRSFLFSSLTGYRTPLPGGTRWSVWNAFTCISDRFFTSCGCDPRWSVDHGPIRFSTPGSKWKKTFPGLWRS